MTSFFVYGTLKRGQANFALLAAHAESVDSAVAHGILYDLGAFPALIEGDGDVHGDIVRMAEVSDRHIVPHLDALEGFDPSDPSRSLFVRRPILVSTPHNGAERALAYFFNGGHQEIVAHGGLVLAHGAWPDETVE